MARLFVSWSEGAGKVPNAKIGSFVVSVFIEEKVRPVNGFYVFS